MMPLDLQVANIPVSKGINTKTDPFQLPFGKMTALKNAVFTTEGRLEKRNGYGHLTNLPDSTSDFLCTFNNNLLAIGNTLQSHSNKSGKWANQGNIVPLQLGVLPIVRNSTNQNQVDSVTSPSGLICTVYTDQDPSNLLDKIYRYCVSDSDTGIYVVPPTTLETADPTYGTPRVFLLPGYFIILFTSLVTATYHLNYIAVSIADPTIATQPASIGITDPAATVAFDACPFNNTLYIAWNSDSGAGIELIMLTNSLVLSSSVIRDNSHVATQVSVSVDPIYGYIWVSYYDSGTSKGYTLYVNQRLNPVLAATEIIGSGTVLNLTSLGKGGILNVYYEISNAYSFDTNFKTNYIKSLTINVGGTVSTPVIVMRSVGLASKAFLVGSTIYFLTAYQSPYQNTYFLSNSSGDVVAKLAYENGGGYLQFGLPNVSVLGTTAYISYLFKFAISSVNKGSGVGVYGQIGINNAYFDIDTGYISTAEIGKNLNISGGFLWAYDGHIPVEQNFHLWPDLDTTSSSGTSLAITAASTGGLITTQNYLYIGTYEWQDNQGNLFRSGVSISIPLASTALTGSTNKVTINFPTLRLTYKIANPPKLVLYRSSVGQPTYYQVTSTTDPILNDPSVDSVVIEDTLSDDFIIGNTILYTNGGVLENTGGSAFNSLTIFDNRLWGIFSENTNTVAYSQPIVDSTPVELSQFLTRFISPTIGTETSTGGIETFGVMDDKLILFKEEAIDYINGVGPDLSGANNQYSEPIFITSTVGCSNENSIAFIPQGLMFESKRNGIWLLGRDLQVKFIGSDVSSYNNQTVLSSIVVPETTYVLFSMSSGITLMYDYYYNQWGEFEGVPAISSTVYEGMHTYINRFGEVLQETPGIYLDGSRPVLMSLTTGWLNLAGLQGYQRAYRMFMMGLYQSPHKLSVGIAYDYNPSIQQGFTITPINSAETYGSVSPYGTGNYGGTSPLEQYRINFKKQKCQSFQFSLREIYDPSFGIKAGPGLTLSGINVVYGYKKGYPSLAASQTVG